MRIDLAGFGESRFVFGIGDFVHNGTNRIHIDLAGFRIELSAEVFFGLVVFPRCNHHGVFNRRHDDLRLDMLFPADLLNHLVQQIRHSAYSYHSTTRFALRIPARGNSIMRPLTSSFTSPLLYPARRPSKNVEFSTGSAVEMRASRPANLSKSGALVSLRSRPGELTSSM